VVLEDLYSDGNSCVDGVLNPTNADGYQDGNFAEVEELKNFWIFTMEDTGLSGDQVANASAMIMSIRYYIENSGGGQIPPGSVLTFQVWDDSASDWFDLDSYTTNYMEKVDPGDYVYSHDISSYIASVSELNAVQFRCYCTGFWGDMYVDSIRLQIVTGGFTKINEYNRAAGRGLS